MNTNIDLTLSLAADGSALPSLFFRSADRLRLEACVAALTQEGRSVALSSQHEVALDHYGKLLAERLRRTSLQARIETYFPASTEALVGQFNEVLAGQTLREAMSDGAALAPERIWVIHDAGALAEHELALLARLVSHFPGANIRVVLLLGPTRRSRKAFDSLGRRFVRWDVEGPTAEQAKVMLEQARIEGCERLVSQLLRHLQPQVVGPDFREPPPRPPAPFSFRAGEDDPAQDYLEGSAGDQSRLATLRNLPARCLERLRPALLALKNISPSEVVRSAAARWRRLSSKTGPAIDPGRGAGRAPAARSSRLRWILALAGLVGLSVAVSAWLHGARFGLFKPVVQQPVKAILGGPNSSEGKPTLTQADSISSNPKSTS